MTSTPRTRPNLLFFMTDQHRVDTLPAYGNPTVQTPFLDFMARDATIFERFYTPTAICTPARASLLTGEAPFRHKLLANYERNVGYLEDLDPAHHAFSTDLRALGYQVGLVGKWHVGLNLTAADFGFDALHMHGWHNPVDLPAYQQWLVDHGHPPYRLHDEIRGRFPTGDPGVAIAARLDQPTEATFEYFLADLAIEQLTRYADEFHATGRPFFLATHFFGPHLPYNVPDEWFDRYSRDDVTLPASITETFEGKPPVQANYAAHWGFDTLTEDESRTLIAVYWGYVSMIDEQLLRIARAAQQLEVWDDAGVFFSADHGEFTGAHRLHDKGPAMYEDIYRVPGLVRLPGGGPAQRRSEFANLIDLSATVLDLAGGDPSCAVDGRSLVPLLQGDAPEWRGDLLAEFHGHHFPYPQRMIVTDRWKLVVNPESVNELYDLADDPDELTNRYLDPAAEAVREDLLHRLYVQLRDRGDNFHHWMASMYPVHADAPPGQSPSGHSLRS